MRGQVALETLVVLAALSGVLLLLLDNYGELFDVIMEGMDRKKAEYAAAMIRDAGRGCPQSEIVIELPYDVVISCSPTAEVKVGDHGEELRGMTCTNEGKGRTVRIRGCRLEIT